MATKENPGEFDCYAAAYPDEPLFVLRANDPLAPALVRRWVANYLVAHTELTDEHLSKAREAYRVAAEMEAWRREEKHCMYCGVRRKERDKEGKRRCAVTTTGLHHWAPKREQA